MEVRGVPNRQWNNAGEEAQNRGKQKAIAYDKVHIILSARHIVRQCYIQRDIEWARGRKRVGLIQGIRRRYKNGWQTQTPMS
jgi:hypothetical protein